MSYNRYGRQDGNGDLGSWIVTLILLVSPLWFVGLILLFRKLNALGRRPQFPYLGPSPGSQGFRTPPAGAAGRGLGFGRDKAMTIGGAAMAISFGLAAASGLPVVNSIWGFPLSLAVLSPVLGLCTGGLALMLAGSLNTRKIRCLCVRRATICRRCWIGASCPQAIWICPPIS